MVRRLAKENYFVNDIWCTIPYKNNKDRIRITKELESNRRKRGIRTIEDDERGNQTTDRKKPSIHGSHRGQLAELDSP